MDKVKLALAIARKYHFWAFCACVVISAPIGWWFAASSLAEQCIAKKTGLAKLFTNVTQQFGVSNQRCIDAIRTKEVDLKKAVYSAWNVLYKEQQKNNPLPDVLGPEFTKEYKELPVTGHLSERQREFYRMYLWKQFPPLLEIGDIRRRDKSDDKPADDGSPAEPAKAPVPPVTGNPNLLAFHRTLNPLLAPAGKVPERPDEKWIGTVEWNYNEYAAIRAKYTWQETPSTLRVTMAQEDLWVYEVLLRAIKKTNEHAGGSAIRRIVALQIGAAAVKGWMAP